MAANEEVAPVAKPGRFARLKVPGAVVLLLLVGAGGGFGLSLALGGGSAAEAAEGAPEEPGAEHGEVSEHGGGEHGAAAAPAHGEAAPARSTSDRAVVTLGVFTVNLRGNGGGRVLRTEIQVEVKSDDQPAIEEQKALLRDAVITLVSDYSYADLEGVDGKTHLRDELVGRLNSVLSSQPPVDRLYFTEFVVQ